MGSTSLTPQKIKRCSVLASARVSVKQGSTALLTPEGTLEAGTDA
jgi:hypothetical protein